MANRKRAAVNRTVFHVRVPRGSEYDVAVDNYLASKPGNLVFIDKTEAVIRITACSPLSAITGMIKQGGGRCLTRGSDLTDYEATGVYVDKPSSARQTRQARHYVSRAEMAAYELSFPITEAIRAGRPEDPQLEILTYPAMRERVEEWLGKMPTRQLFAIYSSHLKKPAADDAARRTLVEEASLLF